MGDRAYKPTAQVKVWDQGQWNWCDLHDDGTWNGNGWTKAHDAPVARSPWNGAPLVIYKGRLYRAARGLNSFD